MKRQHVEAWLRSTYPGETLQAYLVGGPVNGGALDASDSLGSRHRADLQVHIEGRGLDAGRRIAPHSNLCAVVSDGRLAVSTIGGLIGVRPRHLVTSAPRGEFRCEWWINDESEAPSAAYCNVLSFFPDGSWVALGAAIKLLGRTVAASALADEFTAALGADGARIDWREPPPSSRPTRLDRPVC
ncbi:MAG: hypothetical protein KF809_06225 [Chloroflexi bacterium]|nr:hypothetical protein [Chloroflexota bacterium]